MSPRRFRSILAITAAAGAAAALAVPGAATATAAGPAAKARPACSAGTLVHTRDGRVCGRTAHGVTSYLGVRYAAPPVGALRWRPPQPVHHWSKTVHATRRGPECPQPFATTAPMSENCLFLDVERPAGVRKGAHLPVMFEIHGGGFIGEARTDNGADLVRGGKVVYVYADYRLGILGNMALKGLSRHAGDYGLQDQQAALRWVKANIARFGGDPHDVTIFGESAGGASVCDQVASPTAEGLFQKGISISGFYNYGVNTVWWPADCKSKLHTEKQARAMGAKFAASVGCGKAADVVACMRALPAAKLVKAAGQVEFPDGGGAIGPIVNGTTLTMSAGQAFRTGHVNPVRLIIGVGANEFNGGVYENDLGRTVIATDAKQYRSLVHQQFGRLAAKVRKLYPVSRYPKPSAFIAYRDVMADSASVCPLLQADQRLSKHIATYPYLDEDADNPGEVSTWPLGGVHSGINRLVHMPRKSVNPGQRALLDQTIAQWTGFARTGHPTVPHTPYWPQYSARGGPVMALQPGGNSHAVQTASIRAQHHCGFWDTVNRTAPWQP